MNRWPGPLTTRWSCLRFQAINFLRVLFDNKLWHLQGQKQQLNEVSAVNKYLFKPAEAYPFWEHITGKNIDFSRGFLINERVAPAGG
jgi:hypothetical protein